MLYDALLVLALWMLTLFVWIAADQGEAISGWPVQLVLALEWAGFYLLSWYRRGQTLGMTAWLISLEVAMRSSGQWWLPATRRVAPFSGVKSVPAHMVETMNSRMSRWLMNGW